MPREKCPPSRCEVHLERSIRDGIKWARAVQQEGLCVEPARAAEEHYSEAHEAMERCAMKSAFEHLQEGDMTRQKVLRCMEMDPGLQGGFGQLKLRKPPKRKKMKKSKKRRRS
jgi:hypothetical protein